MHSWSFILCWCIVQWVSPHRWWGELVLINFFSEGWIMLDTVVSGISVTILVLIFADNGFHPTAKITRCLMGPFVAIVWIMALANEVVHVLQVWLLLFDCNHWQILACLTLGEIFGLLDAIIGLTIFTVGNSLVDLVANMSIAVCGLDISVVLCSIFLVLDF